MYVYVKITKSKRKSKGYGKELILGTKKIGNIIVNTYSYSEDCFEREPKWIYTITLHESSRNSNKVKTKQTTVCSVNYYDIAEDAIYDQIYFDMLEKLDEAILKIRGEKLPEDELEELQEEFGIKTSFIDDIYEEFKKTEEYKVHKKHVDILNEYQKRKQDFLAENDCFDTEYDVCYDIYGNLTNSYYLYKIQNRKRKVQEICNVNTFFDDNDKIFLKKMYRTLCKEYHPDNNSSDCIQEMQLINRLKEQWGI